MSTLRSNIDSGSSPIKKSIQSSSVYQTNLPSATKTRDLMAKDMSGHFIGPMPVAEFLKEYLSRTRAKPPRLPKVFNQIPKTTVEKNMYQSFVRWLYISCRTN